MADGKRPRLGLSVGATNLAAVTADRAVTRRSVLTLYPQRAPEVGVPSENPNLTERGLVITDFVTRVGDPAGVVAADGSTHRGETLLAEGLRSMAYTATDGRSLPESVAITYPSHWRYGSVDALRTALSRVPEWSGGRVSLLSDSTAAAAALQNNPGLPTRGVIAVCDFGGTGTSLTLVDAASGYQSIAPTLRHTEFSGDQIDQALVNHAVGQLSSTGSFDTSSTSAVGSLTRLRDDCRRAKEELSSVTTSTMGAEFPGYSGEISLTRGELDDVIRQSLNGFIGVIQETLQRNGIRASELAAVASVGGGAAIPSITTTLSQQLRVPVITTPRATLTAAMGAAVAAARGLDDGTTALPPAATAMAPAAAELAPTADATMMAEAAPETGPEPALAWSETDDASGIMPLVTGEYPAADGGNVTGPATGSPEVDGDHPRETRSAADAWYRRPPILIVGTALVMLALGGAVMLTLRHTSSTAPSTPAPSVSTTSAPGSPSPSDATDTQAPGNSPAPSSTQSDTGTPPSTTSETPTSTQTSTTTETPTTTSQTPTSSAVTTTQQSAQPIFPFPRNPDRPRIFQPQPGVGGR